MSNVNRFLERLEREVRVSMSSAETLALVEEARGHLEESIQARLQLGMSLEEAEREALASFGTAREVRQEVRRREPRVDVGFTAVSLAILVMAVAAGQNQLLNVNWAFLGVYALAHLAFIVASFRVRRPQLLIFAVVVPVIWLGMASVSASRYVTAGLLHGPMNMRRIDAVRNAATLVAGADAMRQEPKRWVEDYTRYLQGRSVLAPAAKVEFGQGAKMVLSPVVDRAVGEANWKRALGTGISLSSAVAEGQYRDAEAMRDASARPVWAELPRALGPSFWVVPIFGWYLVGHLLFWSLGVWDRRRRGRRGLMA